MTVEDNGLHRKWQGTVQDLSRMFIKRFGKGFTSGVVLYAGVKGVSALMRNPYRENFPSLLKEIVSVDCLRFAGFLGLYPGIYDVVKELAQTYRNTKDGWNNMVAGGIAGLAIVIEEPTRRQIFCLFAMARAFGASISTLTAREKIPEVPYSETALFCLCCAFLVYCVALNPKLLYTGYYHSVLKWSRDYTDKKLNILFRQPGDKFLSCQEVGLHTDTCTKHALKDWIKSFPVFAKLYFPIHLTPIVIFRNKLLLSRPKRVLLSLVKNVFFSTAFLSSMVMLAKYVICLLRNMNGKPPPLPSYIPIMGGIAAGLGVLFERQSRRKELSLFLIPHTLNALYLWAKEKKFIKHIPYSSVVFFSLSMMFVMHAYEREPESLSLLLTGILRYFIGERTNVRVSGRKKREKTFSEMLA